MGIRSVVDRNSCVSSQWPARTSRAHIRPDWRWLEHHCLSERQDMDHFGGLRVYSVLRLPAEISGHHSTNRSAGGDSVPESIHEKPNSPNTQTWLAYLAPPRRVLGRLHGAATGLANSVSW